MDRRHFLAASGLAAATQVLARHLPAPRHLPPTALIQRVYSNASISLRMALD